MINPIFGLLGRSRVFNNVSIGYSAVRGAARGNKWSDGVAATPEISNVGETRSSVANNPLASYFESVTQGRGIWKWTHYFDIYHRHFRQFIDKDVHVVEVGVYSGGSLEMWKAYFGSKCRIYGIDIEPACKKYEDDRTEIYVGDQCDRVFWRDFRKQVPRVDILIDDGGHLPEQQIVTLEEMLPHMGLGGVYLCEDVHGEQNRFAAYICGLGQALNAINRNAESEAVVASPFQNAISSIHQYPFVTVIEKTCAPVKQFVAPKHGTEWQPFL